MSYFSTDIFEGEMAHARFYDEHPSWENEKLLREFTAIARKN